MSCQSQESFARIRAASAAEHRHRIEREMQRIDQETLQQRQTRLAKDADLHWRRAKLETPAQIENRQAMNREY